MEALDSCLGARKAEVGDEVVVDEELVVVSGKAGGCAVGGLGLPPMSSVMMTWQEKRDARNPQTQQQQEADAAASECRAAGVRC
jgi:hypothetical protein